MIQRYTKPGDVVLDMFMGSGTTLYECELLNRDYIGFDINEEIIEYVKGKMVDTKNIQYFIHNNDLSDAPGIKRAIDSDLTLLKKKNTDLVISHPPYMDIVKFTNKKEDLSNIVEPNQFISTFITTVRNVWDTLKKKGIFVLVIGDVYKNSEVVPLGFYLMNAMKENFHCLLKGIVVKDMLNNRGKFGTEAIHRYRALKFGYYIFKHEYIFVFQKK